MFTTQEGKSTRKLNILLFSAADLLGTGGLNRRYQELSNALTSFGCKIFFVGVVYNKKAGNLNLRPNVHVYPIDLSFINRFQTNSSNSFRHLIWLILFSFGLLKVGVRICCSEKIDVILAYSQPAIPVVYLMKHIFRSFWIYDARGLGEIVFPKLKMAVRPLMAGMLSLERFASRYADKVLVVSEGMGEAIIGYRGLDPSRIAVSEDGVNPAEFNPYVKKGLARSFLRISDDVPMVLYVGSVEVTKGIDRVITCFPYVLRKYPNAKFVVVGGGSYAIDDSVFLKSLVSSSNLAESVIFTGRVEHPAEFIVDADVCVAPSSLYFSPIKVYEYLACKKPVILDKNADIAYLLVSKKAALLTDTTNPSELALTVLKSLQDRDFSREIASNGYELVTGSFTWKRIAEKMMKLMETELAVKR